MEALPIRPECGLEWSPEAAADAAPEVRDSVGNILRDGDSVTVIRSLKVKGASAMLKIGTKVRNIRLIRGDRANDCRIRGFGQRGRKSDFVKRFPDRVLPANGATAPGWRPEAGGAPGLRRPDRRPPGRASRRVSARRRVDCHETDSVPT